MVSESSCLCSVVYRGSLGRDDSFHFCESGHSPFFFSLATRDSWTLAGAPADSASSHVIS